VTGPPLSHGMNRLRLVMLRIGLGMTVVAVKCGSIDPSASNLSLLIQPT
jgi:hypothetical protein